MDDTPRDPVDALGLVVRNYLAEMGIDGVVLEKTEDNYVHFDLGDALDATCVLPIITAVAEQIYRAAGLGAASSGWPIQLVPDASAIMGVAASWVIGPGVASWGVVYPCVMEAAHDVFRRDPMDEAKVLVDYAALLELDSVIRPAVGTT